LEAPIQVDEMILVSIDDHVIEPADMFSRHVPAKWVDEAPTVVDVDGVEQWLLQGERSGSMGLNAVVSWPKEEWGMDPVGYAEMRPGAYDVHERTRDMNRNGVLASMCFPTFPGFSGRYLNRWAAKNEMLTQVVVQAYNDWHIDEWCTEYRGRMIPLAIAPTWDPELMAEEIRRVAEKGARAVTMPELPHVEGLPSYHDLDHWKPVFDALCDTGTVMCCHIGPGFGALKLAPDSPIDNMIILAAQVSVLGAQDLLWGPVMRTYPGLRIASRIATCKASGWSSSRKCVASAG
jgi:predicted TIM-barrel fold metal-dependent hydrolase